MSRGVGNWEVKSGGGGGGGGWEKNACKVYECRVLGVKGMGMDGW